MSLDTDMFLTKKELISLHSWRRNMTLLNYLFKLLGMIQQFSVL